MSPRRKLWPPDFIPIMKPSLRRRIFTRIGRAFGIHPDVSGLIGGAMRLANPMQAAMPGENLPAASRVIASGLWNYSFFQFYPDFEGPFWVQRQYNPEDPAFIPRAGSLLSVNLTHRNWMGFRGIRSPFFAMVDPAGAPIDARRRRPISKRAIWWTPRGPGARTPTAS